jgi:hypothetical protein
MKDTAQRPPNGQPFAWLTREILASDAWRSAGINTRRFIDFLLIEHMNRGGKENGRLKGPREHLRAFGIARRFASTAIDEAEALGLVNCYRGGMRVATTYALTWLPLHDGTPATNQWRSYRNSKLSSLRTGAKKVATKFRNLGNKSDPGLGNKGDPDGPNLGNKGDPDGLKNLGNKGDHLSRKSSYQEGDVQKIQVGDRLEQVGESVVAGPAAEELMAGRGREKPNPGKSNPQDRAIRGAMPVRAVVGDDGQGLRPTLCSEAGAAVALAGKLINAAGLRLRP